LLSLNSVLNDDALGIFSLKRAFEITQPVLSMTL
jgi:hypothetical protein